MTHTRKIWMLLLFAGSLVGCAPKHSTSTHRPYVFTDISGHEYHGYYVENHMPEPMVGKSGRLVVSYENGQKWIDGSCSNGQFDGLVRMWHEDGTLFVQENYSSGKKDGKLIWWHSNGQKQMEIDWASGKKNGLWLEWDTNGNEIVRRQFNDDKELK